MPSSRFANSFPWGAHDRRHIVENDNPPLAMREKPYFSIYDINRRVLSDVPPLSSDPLFSYSHRLALATPICWHDEECINDCNRFVCRYRSSKKDICLFDMSVTTLQLLNQKRDPDYPELRDLLAFDAVSNFTYTSLFGVTNNLPKKPPFALPCQCGVQSQIVFMDLLPRGRANYRLCRWVFGCGGLSPMCPMGRYVQHARVQLS